MVIDYASGDIQQFCWFCVLLRKLNKAEKNKNKIESLSNDVTEIVPLRVD